MEYEQIIEPRKGWLSLDWSAMLHYSDLLWLLVRRDFVSKYKQTILGPAWFIIQPLITTLVFTVIFGNVAKISTDGLPSVLFYLCGLLPWNYFSTCLPQVGSVFIANQQIFSKVYFPRLIVPVSLVISGLLSLALQIVMFGGFWLYFKLFTNSGNTIHISWLAVLVPLLIIQTLLLCLGTGLCLAALTARFRDLTHALPFLVQVWMYITTIAYPLSMFPEKFKLLVSINPMTPIVEAFRLSLLGKGTVDFASIALSVMVTVVILFVGLVLFTRAEHTFVDVV